MVQITLQESLLQRLCIGSLLAAAWLATLSLDSATGFKLILLLFLATQSGLLLLRRTSSRYHPFFSPVNYDRLSLGSQFCSLERDGRSWRFQHPKVLYCGEFLIILKFIPLPDEVNSVRRSILWRCLDSHCLLITPDSLTSEHDWYLRRHLHVLYRD